MKFKTVSHQGVGELRFGQSPDEVRGILQSSFRSFKRTPASTHPCDHFTDLHVFVYYGDKGAEAIELSEAAEAISQGTNLFTLNFDDLMALLLSEDANLTVEDAGCTSVKSGLGGTRLKPRRSHGEF